MATEMNKGVLRNLGLLTPELEEAKNGDLMIVIKEYQAMMLTMPH